jgi:hypothetical protein
MAAFLTWVFMCFYTELWRKAILLGFVGKIYTFACLLACLPACLRKTLSNQCSAEDGVFSGLTLAYFPVTTAEGKLSLAAKPLGL